MSNGNKPNVALIGTGGTIASLGEHSLELLEYLQRKRHESIDALLRRFPEAHEFADILPVNFENFASQAIGPAQWLELNARIQELYQQQPTLDGIVITHGTATLEETAYFLNLSLKVPCPVVVVGSQRPATGLGTDAGMNLVNAIRVAGAPQSRGRGVLVVLNDEIHCAREVSKSSTLKLNTFRSPDFGVLGHADADRVAYYRMPERRRAPDTAFDLGGLDTLPRVDVVLSYAGADGALIQACVAAGAAGIVIAGFAPGVNTAQQNLALEDAGDAGVVIAQCSRVGSGRIVSLGSAHPRDCVCADNLTPQKARILLMLALAQDRDRQRIQALFDTH